MDVKDNYKEIAIALLDAENDKIKNLDLKNLPPSIFDNISNIFKQISKYIDDAFKDIQDYNDLLTFKLNLNQVSAFTQLIKRVTVEKSLWWTLPLIQECYDKSGIKKRSILITYSSQVEYNTFAVSPDIVSYVKEFFEENTKYPVVDLFYVSVNANYDITSIALIGHEIGHIYFKAKKININSVLKFDKNFYELFLKYIKIIPNLDDFISLFSRYIEEYFCDNFGSKIFKVAFDFAFIKYIFDTKKELYSFRKNYPRTIDRLKKSYSNLIDFKTYDNTNNFINELKTFIYNSFSELIKSDNIDKDNIQEIDTYCAEISNKLFITQKNKLNDFNLDFKSSWNKIIPELNAFRPPFETVSDKIPELINPIEAIVITSVYYYSNYYKNFNEYFIHCSDIQVKEKKEVIRKTLINHIKYSISLFDFLLKSQKYIKKSFSNKSILMTLWSLRQNNHPFIIVPTTNPKNQYSSNSVDLRLGPNFLINKLTKYTHINPERVDLKEKEIELDNFYAYDTEKIGGHFTLHPHQFVLAQTLEYVSIPDDCYALVLGRSTWGRLGLNIATATMIGAGYRGCITLELRNLGETPLKLTVGSRICQICLIPIKIKSGMQYFTSGSNKYIGPVTVKIPEIRKDPDWDFLNNTK